MIDVVRGHEVAQTQKNTHQTQGQEIYPEDFSWSFWFALPLYPFGKRRTIRKEVLKDTIWTFDQLQGIFYVVVPIRMTIVKLDEGGLLVYAPVAPTNECIRLVNELVAEHGDVKYIILPTVSGLEHKVFVGPFARCFPNAQVFVTPKQWSFPLNLPLSWLGLPSKRTQLLPEDSSQTPFADEFDYAMLSPIELGPGRFAEVAFFHRRSHTLLVTDSVVSVPEEPPAIVQLDSYPLLFHAKDKASDIVEDNPVNRRKGWQRISLFALYFRPSMVEIMQWGEVFRNAFQAPERSKKAYFGLFPFQWNSDWKSSFDALRGNGRLFVAPILRTLILNRAPKETINWANKVASWNFERIIPCHFDSPIQAQPHQFRQAFSFLEESSGKGFSSSSDSLPEEDFKLLKQLDKGLNKFGILPPAKELK
ncbi:hypothetical protein DP113_16775 [Brasilonema octagenarum UFV-E1]|uniref:DUF4336 domain-containing protein n=1 Tax=Brasilonema sennae CENA114 TaxID=415709 RepID=A0A856MK78_9CYAN|nr:DUF4336 domain-containing protein [Brasilonema sennae]QDL09346.1 hypothetical protein DP114_16840 [Brasilonema sennae CENA114]QDL15702.1 hypothetical protein DP113_16775 [Brasilonema octagenarum UFV-E1]